MKRLIFVVLVISTAASAQAPSYGPAEMQGVMKTSYACGLIDGTMKAVISYGDNPKGVRTLRDYAKESHCENVREIVGVEEPK
jgi:hypothetical protein